MDAKYLVNKLFNLSLSTSLAHINQV